MRITRQIVALAWVLCAVLTSGSLQAAPVLRSPSRLSMSGANQIIVAQVVERLDGDRVRCRRIGEIWGERSEDQVEIRFSAAADEVRVGERYVLVYTRYRRSPLVRGVRELDPEGPALVDLAVVGQAVFVDRPELRQLFSARDEVTAVRQHLTAALRLVESKDDRLRRFGIAEISFDPDLLAQIRAADVEPLRALIRDPQAPEIEREMLLSASASFPEAARGDWVQEVAAAILEEGDSGLLDLGSYRPALIESALKSLAPAIGERNEELFVRWLASNGPGVVRLSIEALDRYDREAARRHARNALGSSDSPSPAQRILIGYLRRTEESQQNIGESGALRIP